MMKGIAPQKVLLIVAVVLFAVAAISSNRLRNLGSFNIGALFSQESSFAPIDQKIVREESIVVDVAESVSPSVVTVAVQTPQRRVLDFDVFGGFEQRIQGGTQQDIGTGFVVSADGLIITNKHVVSESDASYKVITSDDKEYEVKEISRDPSNDIAIIKIDAQGLKPVDLGDSSQLKVGQFAIAIGTALGEFRHTVTTGVISGLGRGITAGDPFAGAVEELDNVIQTDAAINPGNSGGPLLNSAGQVIGVNVAVAAGAQNIGFAIPINSVKDRLTTFQTNGRFPARAFLGVGTQYISQRAAVLNELPQGYYVREVVTDSPAARAGLQEEDIITKIDGQALTEERGVVEIIQSKKVGDTVTLTIMREEETIELKATLAEAPQE
jgi:serine protease Do